MKSFTDFQRAFKQCCRRAINETLDEAMLRALSLSMGDISLAELRAEDHPYAKRHGTPQRPAEIINVQSGEFLEAWHVNKATYSDPFSGSLVNDSKEADFLDQPNGGENSPMFRRPIADEIAEGLEGYLESELELQLQKLVE